MAIKIGSNIASILAQRRLGEATSSLAKIYERLSSGQRINRASDDPAGLAISQDLNVKSRIFGQAIRNVNDGISLHAIADATVEALSDINVRLKELAEQSANGSYSSKQREALDSEAQALSKEYFRISRSAQFNGQKLFDGSLADGLRLQVGEGLDGSILTHVGGKLGDGSVSLDSTLDAEGYKSNAVTLGDLNGDGILDLVSAGYDLNGNGYATVRLGSGNGSFGTATSFSTEGATSNAVSLGDLNGDGILDLVTAGYDLLNKGYATVRLGSGNGSFGTATSFYEGDELCSALSLGDINGDGILDLVTAGGYNGGYASVRLGSGNGSFGNATTFETEAKRSYAVSLGDLNDDGLLDLVTAGTDGVFGDGYATIRLGVGNGSFGAATSITTEDRSSRALSLGDINGDGFLDLVTAGYSGTSGCSTVRLGSGNGSFATATSYTMESSTSRALALGDLNGDGLLDLVTTGYTPLGDGYTTIRLGSGNGSFAAATSRLILNGSGFSPLTSLVLGDVNGDGVSDVISSGALDNGSSVGKVAVLLGQTRDGTSPIQSFSLKTKADALQSMGIFSNNQNNLSSLRGIIGANLSRLDTVNSHLFSIRENYMTASSRITDADVALESANLIRTQILQQAASAVLAQANQAPALALTLLK